MFPFDDVIMISVIVISCMQLIFQLPNNNTPGQATIYPSNHVHAVSKFRKIFTGPTYKLLLSFTVISDVYMSFIRDETPSTKYCLTQSISKLTGSFKIHWIREYLVNFTVLVGTVNANIYKIACVRFSLFILHEVFKTLWKCNRNYFSVINLTLKIDILRYVCVKRSTC